MRTLIALMGMMAGTLAAVDADAKSESPAPMKPAEGSKTAKSSGAMKTAKSVSTTQAKRTAAKNAKAERVVGGSKPHGPKPRAASATGKGKTAKLMAPPVGRNRSDVVAAVGSPASPPLTKRAAIATPHATPQKSKANPVQVKGSQQGAVKQAKKVSPKTPCKSLRLEVERWGKAQGVELLECDGRPRKAALTELSVMARPFGVARPAKLSDGNMLSANIRRLDAGLLDRAIVLGQRFPGKRVVLVSGYRPGSNGSLHQRGQALDIRIEGVATKALLRACQSIADTGCGYYPKAGFIHVDVRPKGAGHATWIDLSGSDESPEYVAEWDTGDGDPVVASWVGRSPAIERERAIRAQELSENPSPQADPLPETREAAKESSRIESGAPGLTNHSAAM